MQTASGRKSSRRQKKSSKVVLEDDDEFEYVAPSSAKRNIVKKAPLTLETKDLPPKLQLPHVCVLMFM